MDWLRLDTGDLGPGMEEYVRRAHLADGQIRRGACPDGSMIGWVDLPAAMLAGEAGRIVEEAGRIRERFDCLVVIGIGGSYLGARTVTEALLPRYSRRRDFEVVFAGYDMSQDGVADLLGFLDGKNFCVNVVSKSGTTLEPSLVFRVLLNELAERWGDKAIAERVVVTTDPERGALRRLAREKGCVSFEIPPGVGGRYSVLSAVGMFPAACAGVDVVRMLEGARGTMDFLDSSPPAENPVCRYAAARNLLYESGKHVEIFAVFDDRLRFFMEWWKQLTGESEGKSGKGLFPAGVVDTTDLHSLGQWIQDGPRIAFETFLFVQESSTNLSLPEGIWDDGLDYLAGKSIDEINHAAYLAVKDAHSAGGVPCIAFEVDRLDEYTLGGLFYFFQRAVAASACVLGVNPFDQPGVEAYKSRMFELLGRDNG